jgi:hypothetical protein
MVIVVTALTLLIGSPASGSPLLSQESTQSQSSSQRSDPQNPAASQQPPVSKPCPATAGSASTKPADCTPTPSTKHRKRHPAHTTASSDRGSTTTVVRNGGTSDSIVAISPTQSNQEASQQLNTTNQMLDNTTSNLKQIAGRKLSTDQEDTIRQIKVYMAQARTAAKNGELQRAYTLANKANMLSADLVGPHP